MHLLHRIGTRAGAHGADGQGILRGNECRPVGPYHMEKPTHRRGCRRLDPSGMTVFRMRIYPVIVALSGSMFLLFRFIHVNPPRF